jgi:hypothetical protein
VLTFIHIGKTGGTYLKAHLRAASDAGPTRIRVERGHPVTLPKALRQNPDTGLVFAIRDPYALFVSGFNSRQRKGQPRNNVEHTEAEAKAFATFPTANDLAEALGSDRTDTRRRAEEAMAAILHLHRAYSWYLKDTLTLQRASDHLVFIFQTESLDTDLAEFDRRLGIDLSGADSAADRHSAPGWQSTDLSESGRTELRRYWGKEFAIYDWAADFRKQILDGPPRLQGVTPPDSPGPSL